MQSVLLYIILFPIIGAFILPLLEKVSFRVRNLTAFLLIFISFLFSLCLLPCVMNGGTITVAKQLTFGFNIVFYADSLAVFMALVSSFLSSIIILYSFGYISHYRNQNEYYSMVVLFLGAMMGLVFSGDLILLYLFWEITAITSWRLIGFYREKNYVLKADKAFLMTFFGAVVMLIGFFVLYSEAGSFDISVIKAVFKTAPISNLAVFLILFGLFSKSATLPFQTWLPDAGIAPSPVTALLHAAILVKIGVYIFARLFIVTIPLNEFWHVAVLAAAGISSLVSAGAALLDNDIKRIIAYSTISQIGFIFLGLSAGTALGIAGGLLYILMHGIAKAGLFLCAGIVEQNTKTKDITKLGGLIKTMPVTAIAFLFCAFSIMGIPPFGGFFCKYMVFAGAIASGHFSIVIIFLVAAFFTILYLLRVFGMVFLGERRQAGDVREGTPIMLFSVAFLAVLSLAGGIFIIYANNVVNQILLK